VPQKLSRDRRISACMVLESRSTRKVNMSLNLTVNDLLSRISELPPMPQVAQKALELIRNPNSSMTDLASVLAMDQALAGLVLRWANSAYYGLKYPVSTVQQAVTYLGQRTLNSLILAASVAALLDRPAPGYDLDRGQLWRHSLGVASGARLIAASYGSQVAEEAYHAGLLCDIGKLAFEILLRNVDTSGPDWQEKSFADLEKEHFGINHAVLGAEIARRWNLPKNLIDAITYHHAPSQANDGLVLASAVHIADAAMMMLGVGVGKDGLQYSLDPAAVQRMGWNDSKFNDLLVRVVPFLEEADTFIQMRRNK
jgi:putative nucleotidyltransferase with HDIG domain